MRKSILLLAALAPFLLSAQLGIKAGINFANVTSASSINPGSQSGFVAGLFLAPQSRGIIGSRTELLFSRQGYSFKSGATTGNVKLDYLVIPQFMALNITKFVQVQFGVQLAFLLNAKADSSSAQGGAGQYPGALSYYNKFDYGFGAGVELHPVAGLVIGARYNISISKMYSSLETGQAPAFSSADAKNNIVQVFTGWIFGGKGK
ncbi:MAG: porin family protein [Bacteroidota bacterium]|nr:porin family protein [Bacteroidota bacterium]MDP4216408.1 porin family protein [Bacteroidota bacterium]MDP4244966.1 porin family protein [Bacteroidota bacterium]MDP4252522.1 porin family protein [Bacteroidota bacterium]MDP4260241.1 porin family protein [Bacteroidota bacterium]